jgi:hypothetical protein
MGTDGHATERQHGRSCALLNVGRAQYCAWWDVIGKPVTSKVGPYVYWNSKVGRYVYSVAAMLSAADGGNGSRDQEQIFHNDNDLSL